VTLIRKIDQALTYEEVERPDKALPNGVRVLGQRGVAGFRIHRYRIIRDGEHAIRERWNDTYPPTTQIVRVGTGDTTADAVHIEDDPHPEYVADELLVMTQGPDMNAAEGSGSGDSAENGTVLEWREPGKYGEYGWSQKEGMPYWRSAEGDEPARDHRSRVEDPERPSGPAGKPHEPKKRAAEARRDAANPANP
jgi:hypothetical protein